MRGLVAGRNRQSLRILVKNAQIIGNFSDETASITHGDDFSLDNGHRVIDTVRIIRTD